MRHRAQWLAGASPQAPQRSLAAAALLLALQPGMVLAENAPAGMCANPADVNDADVAGPGPGGLPAELCLPVGGELR